MASSPFAYPDSAAGLARLSLVDATNRPGLSLHSRSLMIALSHLIEDHAAVAGGTTLVATFQDFSRYRRQAARYRALAPRLAGVYVIGVPDVEPEEMPGVTMLPIEANWPLAQEWAVLASGPNFCAGLLARDEQSYTPGRSSYQFYGRWTTDIEAVDSRLTAFFQTIGEPAPRTRHNTRAIFENSRLLLKELNQRLRR